MVIHMPDPDPGRCLNHRTGSDAYGYPRSKRCLDYEGHQGPCSFEKDPEPAKRNDVAWGGGNFQQAKPKRWVSPLDKERNRG